MCQHPEMCQECADCHADMSQLVSSSHSLRSPSLSLSGLGATYFNRIEMCKKADASPHSCLSGGHISWACAPSAPSAPSHHTLSSTETHIPHVNHKLCFPSPPCSLHYLTTLLPPPKRITAPAGPAVPLLTLRRVLIHIPTLFLSSLIRDKWKSPGTTHPPHTH